MTAAVEVHGLNVRYGRTPALDDVTVTLEHGKIYGLLGRNGAGKTSLLSSMAGFLRPSSGRVLVGGEPVFENPRAMGRVCLVRSTADAIDRHFEVKDVLSFAAELRQGWDAAYAASLLELFEVPHAYVRALSRGQLSALGVVVGLASRAPVTIFDEAHLGMDAAARGVFHDEVLRDFMENPRTIVLSTHLIEEAATLFEEIVLLDRGRLLLREQTEAVLERGTAVTGQADKVDRYVAGVAAESPGLSVLGEKRLGPTKSTTVYGELSAGHRERAAAEGLDLGPIPLQDLFVHLTAGEPK
ncbi:ATP-binding cassette domain-containing protein [Sinosporangium siamense]|uniref:ABC transporter n=1 Tax=Sinosporangium siamense TaxID=1367973 RepID=A0A919REG4_9ACTN|nr:ABC transporter ATP-binding protein [Sinosporangium siamense]GII90914.1 ABC transporter [Sinosporangium siamense]